MGKVQKATDIGFPKTSNIMLYGEPGAGKTTFSTTFPKPILFLDVDDRHQSYAGVKDIDYITYKDEGKTAGAYRDFMKDLRKYQRNSDYATVVLDSTTTLLRLMKNDLLGMRGVGNAATEGLSLAQWGTVVERFERIFDILRGYDTHVIVTSHEQAFQDELTGEIKRVVMMVGKKFPQKAPLFFDEIYHCFREEGRGDEEAAYLFRTQSSRRYPARTSLNVHDNEGNTIPILDELEIQHFNIIDNKVAEAMKDPEAYIKKVAKYREKT